MPRLIAPLVLLLFVPTARADEAEDKALAFVEKLGGKVTRAEGAVVGVDLEKTAVRDVDLKELAAFPKLSAVDLRRTGITDAGVKELAKIKSIDWLLLSGTKVTDAGLKELAPLKLTQL